MSFATRVIRFLEDRRGEEIPTGLQKLNLDDPPGVLAARLMTLLDGSRDRDTNLIGKPRASSLYSACMRMHVLGTVLKRPRTDRHSAADRVIFAVGNAVHHWAQNTPTYFGDQRVGWWLCTACNRKFFGKVLKRGGCSCGANLAAYRYKEHAVDKDGGYPVTGHPDLFLERRPGVIRLAELKTMESDSFMSLKAPLVEHEWQMITYLWACSDDVTLPVSIQKDYGFIFYFSKRKVVKEFPVKAFPVRMTKVILDQIKDKLSSYQLGVRMFPRNLPPMLAECTDSNWSCWKAKSCPTCQECRSRAPIGSVRLEIDGLR